MHWQWVMAANCALNGWFALEMEEWRVTEKKHSNNFLSPQMLPSVSSILSSPLLILQSFPQNYQLRRNHNDGNNVRNRHSLPRRFHLPKI